MFAFSILCSFAVIIAAFMDVECISVTWNLQWILQQSTRKNIQQCRKLHVTFIQNNHFILSSSTWLHRLQSFVWYWKSRGSKVLFFAFIRTSLRIGNTCAALQVRPQVFCGPLFGWISSLRKYYSLKSLHQPKHELS